MGAARATKFHQGNYTSHVQSCYLLSLHAQELTACSLQALNDPSIPPENLPSFEGMVPALPELVAEIIKKHTYVPYAIRSRPNVLNEAEADELAEHVDKLVQLFADVAIQSGYIDGNVDGTLDEIPYVHVSLNILCPK